MNIAKYIISINEKNSNSNIRTIIIVLSSYSYKITYIYLNKLTH